MLNLWTRDRGILEGRVGQKKHLCFPLLTSFYCQPDLIEVLRALYTQSPGREMLHWEGALC